MITSNYLHHPLSKPATSSGVLAFYPDTANGYHYRVPDRSTVPILDTRMGPNCRILLF